MKGLKKLLIYASVVFAGAVFVTTVQAGESKGQDAYGGFAEHQPSECFESREGYTTIKVEDVEPGKPSVKCSPRTGGALWWGDPYYDTVELGEMPVEADYSHEEAVVRARTPHLKYYMPCTTCHNGVTVPYPKNKDPRPLTMHQDIVPDAMDLQHGQGAIWCLDCHNPRNRDTLIDHRGGEVSFNQPQILCGKCHGQIFSDWRDGIHGKRIGSWETGGKKRWWVCTECHNPHRVQVNRFEPLKPEPAPAYPRNADLDSVPEASHGGGHGGATSASHGSSSDSGHGGGH